MIDHELARFKDWVDRSGHIIEKQSDLSTAPRNISGSIPFILKALAAIHDLSSEIREILSGERGYEDEFDRIGMRLISRTPEWSASRTNKTLWEPIPRLDMLYEVYDDEIGTLFGLTERMDQRVRDEKEKVEAGKKLLGPTLWRNKEAMKEKRKKGYTWERIDEEERQEMAEKRKESRGAMPTAGAGVRERLENGCTLEELYEEYTRPELRGCSKHPDFARHLFSR